MRVIHINDVISSAMCYVHVAQPMYVYHSTEELEANTPIPREIIGGLADYLDFVHKHNIDLTYNSNNRFIDVKDRNVWVRTVDKFIPETADATGEITYKLDNDGNKISTDACYVQLYYITPTPTRNIMFTSSGLHTIGMTKWNPTAAQRWKYNQETDTRRGMDKESIYKARVEKLLRTRKESVQMTRAVGAILNPSSAHFLDFNGAMRGAYPWLKIADNKKLLETESFKRTLMSVLKAFYPELRDAIRKAHTPEEMGKKLQAAFDAAESKKDVKGMLDVFGAILTTGYEETFVVNDTTGQTLPSFKPKQLENGDTEMPSDKFLNEPELTMSGMIPDTEISDEEMKASYPKSFIGMDNDEIEKMIGND